MSDARPSLTLRECEVLTHFMADRKALWQRIAADAGIAEPQRLLRELVKAHREAMNPEPDQ
jgi:hypothetical protein